MSPSDAGGDGRPADPDRGRPGRPRVSSPAERKGHCRIRPDRTPASTCRASTSSRSPGNASSGSWRHGRTRATDPMAFRLRHEADGLTGPTGWGRWRWRRPAGRCEGDRLRLRFNVMQGPGQLPLAPGRWRLVQRPAAVGEGAVPVHVATPGIVLDAERDGGRFVLGSRGEFRATPAIDPVDGSMTLEVRIEDVDEAWGLPAQTRSPWRRLLLRPFRIVRVGLFGFLFRLFRAVTRRNGRRILFSSDSRSELGGQPQDRPRPDGRTRPRPRVRAHHAVQVEHHRTPAAARSRAAAVAAGPRRRHRHRRLPAGHLPRRRPRCPDHPAVARLGRVQDRRLQPGRQARGSEPVLAGPQELHARDRQLGHGGPVLRGGIRHPGGAGGPDRDPADGPLLRPARPARRAASRRTRRSPRRAAA